MRRRGLIVLLSLLAAPAGSFGATYIGGTEGVGTATTTCTANVPAGTAAHDLLVAIVIADQAGQVLTPPAGWTIAASRSLNTGGGPGHAWLTYKLAASGDPSAFVWTVSVTGRVSCTLTTWRGVDQTTPIDTVSSGAVNQTDVYLAADTVTTSAPTTLIFMGVVFANPAPSWTPPTDLGTWSNAVAHLTNRQGRYVAYFDWSASGSTGIVRGTLPGSYDGNNKHAWQLALTPVGGGGGSSPPARRRIGVGPF